MSKVTQNIIADINIAKTLFSVYDKSPKKYIAIIYLSW